MNPVERAIRLVLENVPTVMFVAALVMASFFSGIEPVAERYLAWLLLLAVGVQAICAGTTHVLFPETGARYVGWKTSPFQTELGFADLALGIVSVLSFWQGLEFKGALVAYIAIFYAGLCWVHMRDMLASGNREKGNFGGLLVMTAVKAIAFPLLLWFAYAGQQVSAA